MKRVIITMLLILSIGFSSAQLHSASEFYIGIENYDDMNLQAAFTLGLLDGEEVYSEPTSIPNPGHSAGQVWVSYNDGEDTLINALNSGGIYEGSENYFITPSSSKFHYATEVLFDNGDSIQDIITAGDTCNPSVLLPTTQCYSAGTYDDGCGNTAVAYPEEECTSGVCVSGSCLGCTPGADTDTKTCDAGTTCNPATPPTLTVTCNSDGEFPDFPDCTYTPQPRGTPCDDSGDKACDGTGACEGWAGTGCDSCPFGVRDVWTSTKRYCDIDETMYESIYQPFIEAGLYTTDALGSWTSYAQVDALCEDTKVCPAGRTYWLGCRDPWETGYTNWKIKPIDYACVDTSWTPSSSTVCDDETLVQTSNCGTHRTVSGTKDCTVCVPDCPSSEEYSCGTSYSTNDGCGGRCTGVGSYCSNGETCAYDSDANDVICGGSDFTV